MTLESNTKNICNSRNVFQKDVPHHISLFLRALERLRLDRILLNATVPQARLFFQGERATGVL